MGLNLDASELQWHDALTIDPMGLEDEFKPKGPLKEAAGSDSDRQPREPAWDINTDLPRHIRRQWKNMLWRFLTVFAGEEGRLDKISSKFDIKSDADPKSIKSQQSYRASP